MKGKRNDRLHVEYSGKKGWPWRVRRSGCRRALKRFEAVALAEDWARLKARQFGCPVFVHRQDGTVARTWECS